MEKTIQIQIQEALVADRKRLAEEIATWKGKRVHDVGELYYQAVDINGVIHWLLNEQGEGRK
jgi:hypothetical protein